MRDHVRKSLRHVVATLVAIALGLIACALLSGCKTTEVVKEVPVIVEHTTTHNTTELRVDTIYGHDSTFVYVKGDTLIERHYNTIYKVREVFVGDTIRDTIPQVVEVTKTERVEVAAPLRWWQKSLMWLGGILAALVCCCAGWIIWRIRA